MVKKKSKAFTLWLLLALIGLLTLGVDQPDSLSIEQITAYDGVINDNDLLIIVHYDIVYATPPVEAASNTFLLQMFANGTDVNAAQIIAFVDVGYGLGVASFYFTELAKTAAGIEYENPNAEIYEIVLTGNPSVFTSPSSVGNQSIQWRTTADTKAFLKTDIISLANTLQDDPDWADDEITLITFVSDRQLLTGNGEAYFGQVIPNIQTMIPDLFGVSSSPPVLLERDFTFSEREKAESFWSGTGIDTGIQSLADLFQLNRSIAASALGLFGLGFLWFLARGLSGGHQDFPILFIGFTLPLFVVVGFMSMTVVIGMAVAAAMGVAYHVALKRSG